ncbi:MAG: hypothetical protein QXM55_02640 [Ignisphaera sp.]
MQVQEGYVSGFKTLFLEIDNVILGVALEIGPRILYLAPKDNPELNLFGVVPNFAIETPEGVWRIYGGHRLWVAPESMPRAYSLDDKPVTVSIENNGITIAGNPELQNSVQKFIKVSKSDIGVEVVHEIKNIGRWSIEFSCWAISLMKVGGFAIVPIKPRCVEQVFEDRCLLPDRVLALWPYTKLSDRRLILMDNYVVVKQDPQTTYPLKIGVNANPRWTAYYVDGYLFVKVLDDVEGTYPDYGSVVEVYTNNKFLELESLGPIRRIEPGGINRHREVWKVVKVGRLEPVEEDISKIESIVLKNLKLDPSKLS